MVFPLKLFLTIIIIYKHNKQLYINSEMPAPNEKKLSILQNNPSDGGEPPNLN